MKTKDNASFHIVLVKGWVQKDDKFLIAQRSPKELQASGMWALPGGKVENENSENILFTTLKKEIKEEVNVEIGENIQFVRSQSFTRVDGAHVVALTFLCQYISGEAKPLEDTADIKWLTIEELLHFPHLPDFLYKEVTSLQEFLKNK